MYKILGHVGPLGKNLNFFVSLGMAQNFLILAEHIDVVLLINFPEQFEL